MVGKMFKTKLCHLYMRGRCERQSCSFAHGESELRRHSGSSLGRQDNQVSELRGRLDRRHSARHRYSPDIDRTGRSPLRSTGQRRKNKHVDGHSDLSESLRASNGTEDRNKNGKVVASESRDFQEKMKHLQLDIGMLVDEKSKLQIEIEERTQEANGLSSRIQDLEFQLSQEKEYHKRITSRIKKFVTEQNNHTRLKEELKRSEARLVKLVKDFGSDAGELGANAEDSNINAVFDGQTVSNHVTEKLGKRGRGLSDKAKSRKGTDDTASNPEPLAVGDRKRKDLEWQHSMEGHPKRHKETSIGVHSANKLKGSESNHIIPSTSIAAHVDDEFEMEERAEVLKTVPSVVEKEAASAALDLEFPLPPLPSFSQNNYSQHKGDDEDVDVDGVEPEEELVEVVRF